MGLLDKAKDMAKGKGDQIDGGISKAEDMADDRLDEKHDGKIDAAGDKAREAAKKFDRPS
jgi:hypothetical protein